MASTCKRGICHISYARFPNASDWRRGYSSTLQASLRVFCGTGRTGKTIMRLKHLLSWLFLAFMGLLMGLTFTACGGDDEEDNVPNSEQQGGDNQDSDTDKPDSQKPEDIIIVTVDANGQADGGHTFSVIDESNFYIDDIKYTANQGELSVTGWNKAFFKGEANIVSMLKYQGRELMVTSIGKDAFHGNNVLTSVIIPTSVTRIYDEAFMGCTNLTSVAISNSITIIGEKAFSGCSGLESISVESGNKFFDSRDNCNAIIETKSNTLISGCKNTIIPNGVTSIGASAFSYCSGLTSINIPKGVTSIGGFAFSGCSGLTSVTIPNSVTSIGGYAFEGCIGLKTISIPNSVTMIYDYTFSGCTGLTSISIPESVMSIDIFAFHGCSGLTSVIILCPTVSSWFSGLTSIKEIILGEKVTSIGEGAFYGCSELELIKVESKNQFYDSRDNCNAIIETKSNMLIKGCKNTIIPKSVTSIGDYAFSNCRGLITVTIPSNVTSIGESAFYGCSGLTSINIPKGVTSISRYAFNGCSGLKDVFCYAESVPRTSTSLFDSNTIRQATLHVPASAIEAYISTFPWREFGNIVAIE